MVALRCPPTPGKESMSNRTVVKIRLGDVVTGDRYGAVKRFENHPQKLEAMVASIRENGLQWPILVYPDLQLIDGLYRIMALEEMGETKVPVFIVTNFPDAIDYLIEMNEGHTVSHGRVGQIMMAMRPLMLEEAALSRSRGRWRATDPPRHHGRAREAYAEAFHHPSTVAVGRLQGLYMSAARGNPKAAELIKQLEAGIITPHQAHSRLYQRPFFNGDVATRGAQESLLRNTTQHLGAVIKGLTKLESPIKARPQVVQECLSDLRLARATLISAIRELEKETEQA